MNTMHKGFTLIELMIVVAIIAILAAIALPAYQDYAIRSKITEGMVGATAAKTSVSEGFQTGGITGVAASSLEFGAANTSTATKYVNRISVDAKTGEITITVRGNADNGIPTTLNNKTIHLMPNIKTAGAPYAVLSALVSGPLDWGCQSATNTTFQARGFAGGTAGTLPAKYASSECR